MNTINNDNNHENKDINLDSSNAGAEFSNLSTDYKSVQNLQTSNKYQYAHFADSKEMEEGIERILKDNIIE